MKHKYFFYLLICLTTFASLLAGCSSADLQTSIGALSINRVESVEEWENKKPINPTDKILLIYFENKDDISTDRFQVAAKNVFLSDSNGNEYDFQVSGFYYGEYFLLFVVPGSIADFYIHWPDNKPIKLEISE